jgi:hypothetical protein
MTDTQRLAAAVLLFYKGGLWTDEDRAHWHFLTGSEEATTRTLCNLARAVQRRDETQQILLERVVNTSEAMLTQLATLISATREYSERR